MIATALTLLILLVGLSIPVGAALGVLGLTLDPLFSMLPLSRALGEISWNSNNEFLLVAIPLFIMLGEILLRAGLAEKMYQSMSLWLSWLPGGLMHANIGASTLFSATSGSSVATSATVGTVAIPQIKKHGYNESLFLGSLAAGGTLGILVAGWLMDRWNAHKVVSSGFVVTALLIVAMATEDKQIVLLGAFIFLMGVTMNGAQSGLQTLAATFYPTHSRATGIAWMQGIGRFGGVAGTMMGAQLLAMQWEVQSILMFLCVPALIAAIATVCKMSRKPTLQPAA